MTIIVFALLCLVVFPFVVTVVSTASMRQFRMRQLKHTPVVPNSRSLVAALHMVAQGADQVRDGQAELNTCRFCKCQFSPLKPTACQFHSGIYTGRLNRVNDIDTSDLQYFWTCCGSYELGAPGCMITEHRSVRNAFSHDVLIT